MLSETQVSGTLWRIELVVPSETVAAFECALERISEAVLIFMIPDDKQMWHLSALLSEPPNHTALIVLFAVTTATTGLVSIPDFIIKRVEVHDWAVQNQSTFPPLTVGRFYIYGEHIQTPPPMTAIPLQVDATIAFGSGEHESTQGCLLALESFTRSGRHFHRCMDIGCGTGILSLAVAKLWQARVYAVDIDSAAVRVTRFNARRNGVHRLVSAQHRDGYMAIAARTRLPFDLILANLLLSPLAKMARNMARLLPQGGIAVLSGLLTSQERRILNIYRTQGFSLERRIIIFPWLTLILKKKKGSSPDSGLVRSRF